MRNIQDRQLHFKRLTDINITQENVDRTWQEFKEAPTIEVRNKLVEFYYLLAPTYVKRTYPSLAFLWADLIGVAYYGLVKAVDGFDPNCGTMFSTYAYHTMAGNIRHYLRDRLYIIRPPSWMQTIGPAILRVRDTLSEKLGRPPTDEEIAAEIDAPSWKVQMGIKLLTIVHPLSIDAPVPTTQSSGEEHSDLVFEGVGKISDDGDEAMERLNFESIIEPLSDVEKEVLIRYYIHDQSQPVIAKALGCSQMHISRIRSEAQQKLRELYKEPSEIT